MAVLETEPTLLSGSEVKSGGAVPPLIQLYGVVTYFHLSLWVFPHSL
jgi:hypothetical protein